MQGRRSLKGEVLPLDDKGGHIRRKRKSIEEKKQADSDFESDSNNSELFASDKESEEEAPEEMAADNPRLMKDFARPIVETSPSCIVLDDDARNYELKTKDQNMLPIFYGLPSEDPLSFIRDFYATLQTIPLQGLTEGQLRMRCFPYTLKDRAKLWLLSLQPRSLNTWEAIYDKFTGKFYSHQKTTELRSQIATFAQAEGEPFHEAWDRFKLLLIQCPHHHYPLELQNQFFYDGLTMSCQATVDNAAGGAMGEKTAEQTYELYEMLGANSQQKSVRGKRSGVYEISSNSDLALQVANLTTQIKTLSNVVISKGSATGEVCAICGIFGSCC